MKHVVIRKDSYFDSVFLLSLSKELRQHQGVSNAAVVLGTPANLALLKASGFDESPLESVGPSDLVIALEGASAEALSTGEAAAQALLARKASSKSTLAGQEAAPHDLEGAVAKLDQANLAIISVPGIYAAREARKALLRGLHVMLFSDNVSIEDEIALKTLARSRGLLLMGPDCGTAILNGHPLCLANAVNRGTVGVVAASGTGLQEVTSLVHWFGAGISQAIGTGGRDLKDERVGGLTMLTGIEALAADPGTQVIVVISKPPAAAVADRVVAALHETGKPAVVHFLGRTSPERDSHLLRWASSLEETARMAAALVLDEPYVPAVFDLGEDRVESLVLRETSRWTPAQKYLRGYFTGGTLADEALFLLHGAVGPVNSNLQTDPSCRLEDPRRSVGHTIVDLGDDTFTVGRPHPMIDPTVRTERILSERDDAEVAVILVDVVLGYGSHPDPAGALVPALAEAMAAAVHRGGWLSVVASITGTEADPQGFAGQKAKLEALGVTVMPTNRQASLLVQRMLSPRRGREGRA